MMFQRHLTAVYPGLTGSDVDDLYQDAFIAIQENIRNDKVSKGTTWNSYILTIGLNLAGKRWRKEGKSDSVDAGFGDGDDEGAPSSLARRVDDILKTLPAEDERPFVQDPEAQSLLGYELEHTPALCAEIIRAYYMGCEKTSMAEIAAEVGLKNADTAKAKKNQCMKDLIGRLTKALRLAGFDVSPKKRNSNGKN